MTVPSVPPALRCALEALEGMEELTIIEGWRRYGDEYACRLKVSLPIEPTDHMPATTDWYAVTDPAYPAGDLTVFPSKTGGISATFPHQTYNSDGYGGEYGRLPWRPGNPCLTHPLAALGDERVKEPKEVRGRLAWQVERLKRWIIAAATDRLQVAGDPFELPQAPNKESGHELIFCEENGGTLDWSAIGSRQGVVDLFPYGRTTSRLRPVVFRDEREHELKRVLWNDLPKQITPLTGLWLLLDRLPVERPWRLPSNWEELASATLGANTNLGDLFERQSRRLRDGKRHILMIGYPIPERVGDPASRLHWSAILLPALSTKKAAAKKGYRGDETSLLSCDKWTIRHNKMPVPWVSSANWAEDQIRSRGAFPKPLRSLKLVLIGAGALGSMVAELLTRAGANIAAVVDGDILTAGNTCRHTMTLREVGFGKAASVVDRLKAIRPMSQPDVMNERFPPDKLEWRTVIDDADLIIECTGDDAILLSLKNYPWPKAKRFISLSLGWKASRLYCFSSHGPYFPAEIYREHYSSWKEAELSARDAEGLTWEGIGCWHPVFPARAEDVMLGATVATKFIEASLLEDDRDRFEVYSLDPEFLKQAPHCR